MEGSQCTIPIAAGVHLPLIGLGTFNMKPAETSRCVREALSLGYRHFDTAFLYHNETEIGVALQQATRENMLDRKDVFITTKFWCQYETAADIRKQLMTSLDRLELDYIDLYLIHMPWRNVTTKDGNLLPKTSEGKMMCCDVNHMEIWRELEKFVDEGRIRAIGVSNFNSRQIEGIISEASIKPSNLQVECHPYLAQFDLRNFCTEHGVSFTAYAPLGAPGRKKAPGTPEVLHDPVIRSVAERYSRTSPQVALCWLKQRDIAVIPKTCRGERMRENMAMFDFQLDSDDMKKINDLNKNLRYYDFQPVIGAPQFPFSSAYDTI